MDDYLLTIKQVASMLALSERTIERMYTRGMMPRPVLMVRAQRKGKRGSLTVRRWHRDILMEWIDQMPTDMRGHKALDNLHHRIVSNEEDIG